MEKIEISYVDQEIFVKKLDNGFTIYFLPFLNKNGYSAILGTKFGSVNTEFNNIKAPAGIAHFLEHKMFEQENKEDPFNYYSKTGTNCNASTNYKSTVYTINGNKEIYSNIDYLLNYVYSPYFTNENVEKEKGIICEELLMYQDMPDRVIIDLMYESLFKYCKVKEDVGGDISSVKKTTKEDLYNCYNVFYQPFNMYLMVSGNFDKDKLLEVVLNNKLLNKPRKEIAINNMVYKELESVYKKELRIKLKVEIPKLAFAIKIKPQLETKEELFEYDLYLALLLQIIFGHSSKFREKARNEDIMTSFYTSRGIYDGFFTLEFMADSKDPDKFVKYIKEALKNIVITEEELERTKKVWLSSEVMIADSFEASLENMANDIIEYDQIFPNKCTKYKELNLKKFYEIINKIDFTNSSTVIIEKK